MKRQDELEVPVVEVKELTLAFDYLGPARQQMTFSSRLVNHLLLHILLEVTDGHDIVVYLFMFTGDQEHGHLVQNHCTRRHQLELKHSCCHSLTRPEIVLINHFYCHVDGLTCLPKFHAHFINPVNDSLSTLKRTTNE